MEFYFEKLYGDSTRIGYFSERDFGWQSDQPALTIEQFKDYSLAEADILVIGDSFSEKRVWQTRAIAARLKVTTIHWKELKTDGHWGSLPDNLAETLRIAGFKGHYVVIESIERLFQERVKKLSKEYKPLVKHNLVISEAPYGKRERVILTQLNGLSWSVKTLYNKIKLSLNIPDKHWESERVQPIKFDGCQVFSHRLCHYALFLYEEFKKETFNSIDNVLAVNKNLQNVGIQPIWLVVPDKSTVYLGYGKLNKNPYQNIWQQFSQYPELIAPDLGEVFTQQSRLIKDFYMPNDTHLSTNGFLYLGDFMTKGLHKLQANQPNPFAQ
jgi:hypothetical protein